MAFGRIKTRFMEAYERFRLTGCEFVLVSNNCWGSTIYSTLKREYNTPFVGLFICPEDYLRLLKDFERYIESDILFESGVSVDSEKGLYPVGVLGGDVSIHFLHYSSVEEARDKWTRRAIRCREALSKDVSVYVKFCDRDNASNQNFEDYYQIPFGNKIAIRGGNGAAGIIAKGHQAAEIYAPRKCVYVPDNRCINGMGLFYRRYSCFDFANWVATGRVSRTLVSRVFGWLA